jgi:hypothetical protein
MGIVIHCGLGWFNQVLHVNFSEAQVWPGAEHGDPRQVQCAPYIHIHSNLAMQLVMMIASECGEVVCLRVNTRFFVAIVMISLGPAALQCMANLILFPAD